MRLAVPTGTRPPPHTLVVKFNGIAAGSRTRTRAPQPALVVRTAPESCRQIVSPLARVSPSGRDFIANQGVMRDRKLISDLILQAK